MMYASPLKNLPCVSLGKATTCKFCERKRNVDILGDPTNSGLEVEWSNGVVEWSSVVVEWSSRKLSGQVG